MSDEQKQYKIIELNNKHCKFITNDIETFNALRKYLSYKEAGVEFSPAYRNGYWNGINYLMDKKGVFLSGLLHKTNEFLKDRGIVPDYEDRREKIIDVEPIDLSEKLKQLNMVPRYYQEDILKAAIDNNRGIVRAATGAGKTSCIALIAAHFNKPTIVYVIGLDLLNQFHALFSKLFDEEIGYIGDGICNIKRINIATVWSIGSALKLKKKDIANDDDFMGEKELNESQYEKIIDLLKSTKIHIFDESHIASCNTIKKIFSVITPERIYGFSGTPYKMIEADLLITGILGEKIIDVGASELIKQGYLAQPIIKFVRVPKININYNANYQTVYKEYITENVVRNKMVVDNAKDLLSKGYQVLVLFRTIQHGKNIAEMFDEENIKYEFLSGKDSLKDRNEVKDKLLSHQSNLVIGSSIYECGIDVPSLSALIMASPNKSLVKVTQKVGRCIRKYPGKKFAAVIDFYDDVRYLKGHAKARLEIYNSEPGFIVHIPKNIPELK